MVSTSAGRRALILVAVLVLVLLASTLIATALLAAVIATAFRGDAGLARDYVALVELSGPIDYSRGGMFAGAVVTPDMVEELVDRILSDTRAKAVVIIVNSPGGTMAAFEVYELLRKLHEERVVVVYITGMGTSGGYLISLPSHAIVAHPTAIVGSVGIIAVLVSYAGLLEKLGIDSAIIASGDLKDVGTPFREITSKDIETFSNIVHNIAAHFASLVEKHRGGKITDLREVLRGGVYPAREALKLGLIDYVGTLEDAVRIARDLAGLPEDAPVVKIERRVSLFDVLLGMMSVTSLDVKRALLSAEVLVMWPLPAELAENYVVVSPRDIVLQAGSSS